MITKLQKLKDKVGTRKFALKSKCGILFSIYMFVDGKLYYQSYDCFEPASEETVTKINNGLFKLYKVV